MMHSLSNRLLRKTILLDSCRLISNDVISRTATAPADVTEQYDPRLADAKPFDEMPRIKTFPFIGSAWAYFPIVGKYSLQKLHLADRHKHREYGDVVREQFGHLSVVNSFRPEDMETIQRHEGKYPSRGELTTLKAYRESRKQWYTTTGVMVLQGKEWHDLRSKMQPHLMKPKTVLSYLDPMQEVAKDLIARIDHLKDTKNEMPNLDKELYNWALESIAVVGLDTRLGCLENNLSPDSDGLKMITAVNTTFETMNRLEAFTGNVQYWKYFSTPTWRRFVQAGDVFTEIARKYISRALDQLKNAPEDKELTMLQAMLSTKGMDISRAMVNVTDMLMAGIDTTSHTVAFLLYHLAKNPDKQEKLYQDLLRIFPSKTDKITASTFNELRYLKSCLKEAMRLDPIVRGNARTLDHDVSISGYRVPAGTTIVVLLQVLGRSEQHYKQADKFLPERWMDKEDKPHPYVYLPFGFGTRSCVGRRLAELEIFCLVTEIVRKYRVEYHHKDMGMYTRLVNVPDKPLLFSFIDR